MSPVADGIVRRLDATRQRWWVFTLLSTSVLAICASFGTLILLLLLDALVRFSQFALWGMLGLWLAVTVGLIVFVCRRLARSQRTLEATARRVEAEFPELGSNLINVVQLSTEAKNGDPRFCEAAVVEAARAIGHARFEEAAEREGRLRRFAYCMQTPRDLVESFVVLGLLVLVAVLCHLLVPSWGSAASRLMAPWRFVPAVGKVGEIKVTPGNADVLVGGSVDIAAEIENPNGEPNEAALFVTHDGEQEEKRQAMAPDEAHARYTIRLDAVTKGFEYRVEVGDSQSEVYRISLQQKPTISEVEVTYRYPKYMKRGPETHTQELADLEAPQFTEARLRVVPSVAIRGGYVLLDPAKVDGEWRGQKVVGTVDPDGALLVQFVLDRNKTFTIHLADSAGHTDPDPRVNRARVREDKAPTVGLVKPARNSTAAPGSEVPVTVRAKDDFGLDTVWVEMKVRSPKGEGEDAGPAADSDVTVLRRWEDFPNGTTVPLVPALVLDPEKVQAGQEVLVRAVAMDGRRFTEFQLNLMPQRAETPWHVIRLIGSVEEAKAEVAKFDGIRAALWKILEKQVRARINAAMVLQKGAIEQAEAAAGDSRTQQIAVRTATLELVTSIDAEKTDDKDRLRIREALADLAGGDMFTAVEQADQLVKVKTLDGFGQPVAELNGTQDRIIAALRKLLDVARAAQNEVLADMKKRVTGDMPDDVQEKLKDLRDKLDEFLEQQKKVIEATENLAKKNVEDFTEEDKQVLEELAAAQDDWSKFLEEIHSDLSKLPEQDFANPSLLKELNEIQTELKMAEDALTKKTADIAVPLEQLGAEMAEEIKTNLEKWLPDTPDRERWSQEEGLDDAEKEAPMAELPGELEDLIGELMEEEEDLFDEMEDVSSSAADSLDKGAGWDVADGPISNMSAKGATGNRLPNTSEIGGRAGEGRSGKSSGEFVGDEAVGKGGRKTPSRLTPDPYVAGQVKDHSKDPTGGATGGGKESGQGGEGLEGPAPQPPGARNLERLAGKQAALRNKAEGVDLSRFGDVQAFHHTDLEKMIDLMADVERDLRTGRYQNVPRLKKVLLDTMTEIKQHAGGEFEIREDATANLPADIRKELLSGMDEAAPVGWKEQNQKYFDRLVGGGAAADSAPDESQPQE